jgi:3-oxoacyl-[acyl-carrier protein] reductase
MKSPGQETPTPSKPVDLRTQTPGGNGDHPKVVLVTGAAGGLGQGLLGEFLAQGWRVGAGFQQSPQPGFSDKVLPVLLDVTSSLEAGRAVNLMLARWGRIDALVNNAGALADRPIWQLSEPEWDRVLAVNLKGAALCAQAVLRPMLKQREGQIINIASFSGRVGARGQANYAAAKAGLLGLTQSLAKEAGPRNVRVNAILPGVLPTAMTSGLGPAASEALAAANALGRSNSVAEVARFVAFLATLKNVSGQVFQLDSRIAPWC